MMIPPVTTVKKLLEKYPKGSKVVIGLILFRLVRMGVIAGIAYWYFWYE